MIIINKRTMFSRISKVKFAALLAVLVGAGAGASVWAQAAESPVNVWWPTQEARLSGLQPFKGDLVGTPVEQYNLFWSVDNGSWNPMPTSYEQYPHKETTVDVSTWNWRGAGPYKITYTATDRTGNIVAQHTVEVSINSETPAAKPTAASATTPAPTPVASAPATMPAQAAKAATATSATAATAGNPLSGMNLYVQPGSGAERQAAEWRASRPADAAIMQRLAGMAQGKWLGGWNANVEADTRTYVDAAKAASALPVLVAYNIPQRDCGSYSAGGSANGAAYLEWIRGVARGIGANPAAVILEPDAVSGWDCLSAADRATRQKLLVDAIAILKAQPAATVYLDAGHSRWHGVDDLANRLRSAGLAAADGFSLNVSNYITTQENADFGAKLSAKLGGARYVVDTSRNGAGPTPDSQWCNPLGRALGQPPTTRPGVANVDAYLWLKTPGESDGACNGGPGAGQWWADYAIGLARRAGW